MTPYPEYKATNLPWLPQIPAHWDWLMLSQLTEEQCVKNIGCLENNVLSLSYGNIVRKKNIYSGLSPQDFATYQIVYQDNIILRLTDLQNDHRCLRTGLVKEKGIITSAYTCLKVHSNASFVHYLLHAYDLRKVFYGMGGGVRQSIGFKDIRSLRFPVAPVAEQEQIVRYLDSMTAKINKLIRAKKKICDLIFEEIILLANEHIDNANLPRYRLKNVIKLVGDQIIREDETLYTPIGVLNRGRGVFHKQQLLGKDLGDSEFFNVSPGDMIFSGQFAWEGAVAILQDTERGCIASHRYPLARAINPELLKLEYLWAFFQTKYGDMLLNIHSHGAAGRNRPLNIVRLLSEAIPIPPLEEQKKIEKLFLQLKEAKELAAKYSAQLQEYKNSLIASVVTGQVDVRNIQVEDFDPADLISETDDDPAEDDDQPQEESEVE